MGNLNVLEWLHKNGCRGDSNSINMAIDSGYIDVAKWLIEEGYEVDPMAIVNAISINNLDFAKWLYDIVNNFDITTMETAVAIAVETGNMEIMEWLYENNCILTYASYIEACRGNNMQIMNWLYKKNCPFDLEVCNFAAEIGNLKYVEMVVWNWDVRGTKMCVY